MAVILDHLLHQPRGGFVGVDIFFVISGFLITGVILREFQTSGWVSFREFYIRRARRLLPVALVVLVVVVIAAFFTWYRPRAEQTLIDAFSASAFVSNWHFVRMGADYLQASGPLSPVQHYWSLSVEEQFYVIWPVLVLAVLWFSSRHGRRALPVLLTLTVFIALVSLAWSVLNTTTDPAAAYFDTAGRAWELLAGALIAIYSSSLARVNRLWSLVLTWLGLAAIVTSLFAISPTSAFPGPWALLPVAGAVMVLAGGSSGSRPANRLLDNRTAQYFGKISYSLYLWHFPVIIFGIALLPDQGWWTYILLFIVMLGISHVSFHFIEEPFRRSKRARKSRPPTALGRGRRKDLALAAGIGFLIVAMSAAQLHGPSFISSADSLREKIHQSSTDTTTALSPQYDSASLGAALALAASATTWPLLSPSLDELSITAQAPEMDPATGCRNVVGVAVANICSTSESPRNKTALVIGDSVAISWMPAVEAALDLDEWRVVGLGFGSCPAITSSTASENCSLDQARMLAYAAESRADLVITSSSQSYLENSTYGASAPEAFDEWRSASIATLFSLKAISPDVVIISNPPKGMDPLACATRLSGPDRCVRSIDPTWFAKSHAESKAARISGTTYIDASRWICDDDDQCPLYSGTTPIRFDEVHLTGVFSRQLGTLLAARLPVK
jgi:peptidoglycan/LPS O-acetylase OafA/YrhL